MIYTLLTVSIGVLILSVIYLFDEGYDVELYGISTHSYAIYSYKKTCMMGIIVVFIMAIILPILLMFKKIRENNKARISLSVSGIVLAVNLIFIPFILNLFAKIQVVNDLMQSVGDFSRISVDAPSSFLTFTIMMVLAAISLTTIFILNLIKKKNTNN